MTGVAYARVVAWELRARHRWGLGVVAAFLAVLGATKAWVFLTGRTLDLDAPHNFAFVVVLPMTATFAYVLTIFTYGYAGDLGARGSIYPARRFTLPVPTHALATWPMLLGGSAMLLLWAATRALAFWPADVRVPVLWPGVLAWALLAWAQAIAWMPYPLPGLRVAAFVGWLMIVDTIVLLALHFEAREWVMVALLAPHPPLAYVTARHALRRARTGDVPDWSGALASRGARAHAGTRFRSAAAAQRWLEWRQYGRALPTLVAMVVPGELALLWIAGDSTGLVWTMVFGALITPPFMAAFTAARVAQVRHDDAGLAPFTATRPLTSTAILRAKFQVSVLSTLVTWAFVLAATALALWWSGTWHVVAERAQRTIAVFGIARTVVLATCIVLLCIVGTWRQLVQTLFIVLSGRAWLVRTALVAALVAMSLLGPVLQWISDNPGVQRALWNGAFTWLPALLVVLKLAFGSLAVERVHRGTLLEDRTLVALTAAWAATVFAIYGMLLWFAGTALIPRYLLMCIAVLSVPLVRVAAAPLALAWNRHR